MIRNSFVCFCSKNYHADNSLTELLHEDCSYYVPASDAIAFEDFLGSVDAVLIEEWPCLKVEDVKEKRIEPVNNDWESKRKMFVGYKCEDWRTRLEGSCLVRVERIHDAHGAPTFEIEKPCLFCRDILSSIEVEKECTKVGDILSK